MLVDRRGQSVVWEDPGYDYMLGFEPAVIVQGTISADPNPSPENILSRPGDYSSVREETGGGPAECQIFGAVQLSIQGLAP